MQLTDAIKRWFILNECAAVSLVLAVSGTLAILFGVQRIGVERYAAYDALVRKGRTAADEMRI